MCLLETVEVVNRFFTPLHHYNCCVVFLQEKFSIVNYIGYLCVNYYNLLPSEMHKRFGGRCCVFSDHALDNCDQRGGDCLDERDEEAEEGGYDLLHSVSDYSVFLNIVNFGCLGA